MSLRQAGIALAWFTEAPPLFSLTGRKSRAYVENCPINRRKGGKNMERFVASFVAALVIFALPLAAQERADEKPKDEAKSAGQPPRAVYQHQTTSGRLGKFELNGDRGKADYYFNGQHRQTDLVYVRSAQMREPSLPSGVSGWVYQVSSKDKKEQLWFFFAAAPLAPGGDQYAMFYSTTTPSQDGKQPWMRIRTPGGTKRPALDKKGKGSEEVEK
jgi:hypothetical protein